MHQRPHKRVRLFLRRELPRWAEEGLVDGSTAEALSARYGLDQQEAPRAQVFFSGVAPLVAVLVGMGVILWVAANWSDLTLPLRLGLLEALVVSCATAAFVLLRRERPLLAQSLLVLTGLSYGAAMALVAQTWQLQDFYPTGFLLWGLALVPLAWATESLALLVLVELLVLLHGAGTLEASGPWSWVVFPLVGIALEISRRTRSDAGVLVGVYGLQLMVSAKLVALRAIDDEVGLPMVALVVALSSATISQLIPAETGLDTSKRVLRWMGHRLSLFVLFVLGFKDVVKDLARDGDGLTAHPLVVLSFLGVAALLGLALRRLQASPDRGDWVELAWLTGVTGLGMLACLSLPYLKDHLWLALVGVNLLLLVGALGTTAVGLRQHDSALAFTGVLALTLQVLARFVDSAYNALPRSFGFMAVGFVFLALAYALEKSRRGIAAWLEANP